MQTEKVFQEAPLTVSYAASMMFTLFEQIVQMVAWQPVLSFNNLIDYATENLLLGPLNSMWVIFSFSQ